ncbi:MAG: hypothetical protein ACRD1H_16815 [Vicinamibacterales bacterium]
MPISAPRGVSNCGMLCKEYWPPALAPANAQPSGDDTVITFDDGTKQWAYKDRPPYTYVDDKAPATSPAKVSKANGTSSSSRTGATHLNRRG